MIEIAVNGLDGEIAALMARFRELPRHIARKHLAATMRRVLKDGVPVLRKLTPYRKSHTVTGKIRRDIFGRFEKGSGKKTLVRGGAMRRAVTVKGKYIPRKDSGAAYGVIGYRGGVESRKAIWLEFGTKRIVQRDWMSIFNKEYKSPAASRLVNEMRNALEKSARELASGKNPGRK